MNDNHFQPRVLVTGSSGLIGRSVVENLIDDYQVIGCDLKGDPHAPPQIESICLDLTDATSVETAVRRVRHAYGPRIASVVHLAAYYDFSGEPSEKYEQVTVQGTRRLLDALQEMQVEQFVFSSTMLVHQPTEPGRPLNEDWPLEAKWDYPQSKIDTERIIAEHRGSIHDVRLRIAGAYTDRCDSIPIAHQIERIHKRQLTAQMYPGDVSRGQAFVHLDDLTDAIRRAVDRRKQLPDDVAILIGEPDTYSYDQIQRELARLIHDEEDWETRQVPKSFAKSGAWLEGKIPGAAEPFIKPWMIDMADDHYELSISRARELLDWEPRHRLIDTLPAMVRALERDPVAWYKHHKMAPPERAYREAAPVG
jgi:nucleoside-diphosphate-sugar epimerase